jgi:hypothetical protein
MEIEKMTLTELEELNTRLTKERDEIHEKQRQVVRLINEKKAKVAVEKKVAGMSDSEKDALRQALQPSGIKSGEAFGIPGA